MSSVLRPSLVLAAILLCVLGTTYAVPRVLQGGVEVEITKAAPTAAECAVRGDTVSVHYVGRLRTAEGTTFDSSKTAGKPFSFTLGKGGVIPAWDTGVEGMCVGEVRTIVAPADMAYGAAGYSTVIPPNTPLWFEIELLSVTSGGGDRTSTISLQQLAVLAPLLIVVTVLTWFGYKLLNVPKKKEKQQERMIKKTK